VNTHNSGCVVIGIIFDHQRMIQYDNANIFQILIILPLSISLIQSRNLHIRFAFELESKIGDAKAITLCKSHVEILKRANEDFLADKGDDASASGVSSSSLAKCIEFLTEKLLSALEQKVKIVRFRPSYLLCFSS
jgi:hypothetical protein